MLKTGINLKIRIDDLWQTCLQKKNSFAFYKLPDSSLKSFVSGSEKILNENPDFSSVGSGFVVSPFQQERGLYFINNDVFIKDIENVTEEIPFKIDNKIQDGRMFFEPSAHDLTDKTFYTNLVSKAIQEIKHTSLDKVVFSRKKLIGKINNLNILEIFNLLCHKYPSAFVSATYISSLNQVWIGASPEILVSEDKSGIFKTVALAGTQYAFDSENHEILPKNALWSQKEIEEQALVGRYIIDCLKKIRVREYLEVGPKTVKAGNLLHLKSTFSINSAQINFSNLSTVMLNLLHPTSAVCGMPKELSMNLINQSENYNRELYSGFLGPINIQSESHLFVNLRTIKIENTEVFAYAGAGITEDSNPEKEWTETEYKMETVSKVFDNFIE